MLDITLVTCNYNTPDLLETMLKSWVFHNKNVSDKLLVMEHSTLEDTVPFLNENNIKYIKNQGAVHYRGVEAALHLVNTKYMLLLDTDIVFHKSIEDTLKMYIDRQLNAAGWVEGNRHGHILAPRIHPWFCFIDIEFVRANSIRFVDMKKVRDSESTGFYQNSPISGFNGSVKYDVGSTFLMDLMECGGKVLNHKIEGDAFTHFEGMSWFKYMSDPAHQHLYKTKQNAYKLEQEKYASVDIKDFFN